MHDLSGVLTRLAVAFNDSPARESVSSRRRASGAVLREIDTGSSSRLNDVDLINDEGAGFPSVRELRKVGNRSLAFR